MTGSSLGTRVLLTMSGIASRFATVIVRIPDRICRGPLATA
jgi:hypothetical protein